MKITADVSLHVTLDDGTRVYLSQEHKADVGDNPAFASGEAAKAIDAAREKVLRGFAAQIDQPAQADPVVLPGPQVVAIIAQMLDQADAPLDLDPELAKQALRDASAPLPQATDDEWNAAILRRQMAANVAAERADQMPVGPASDLLSPATLTGVGRVVTLLDQLDAPNDTDVAKAKDLVEYAGADPLALEAEWREAVRIRRARYTPPARP